jgi:hypothetical protein
VDTSSAGRHLDFDSPGTGKHACINLTRAPSPSESLRDSAPKPRGEGRNQLTLSRVSGGEFQHVFPEGNPGAPIMALRH